MPKNNFSQGGCRQGFGGSGKGCQPGTICVCPQCGAETPHKPGIPCIDTKCPSCGAPMTRKF